MHKLTDHIPDSFFYIVIFKPSRNLNITITGRRRVEKFRECRLHNVKKYAQKIPVQTSIAWQNGPQQQINTKYSHYATEVEKL